MHNDVWTPPDPALLTRQDLMLAAQQSAAIVKDRKLWVTSVFRAFSHLHSNMVCMSGRLCLRTPPTPPVAQAAILLFLHPPL